MFSIVQFRSPFYHYNIDWVIQYYFLGKIQCFWKDHNRERRNWIKLGIWGDSHKPYCPKNQGLPYYRNLSIQNCYQYPVNKLKRSFLLCLQDSCCSWRHAIYAPVCVSVFVTNGNREPTIVGSYHRDGFPNITRNVQLFVLTSVGCLVLGSIWGLA